jgi:hypothetical protein
MINIAQDITTTVAGALMPALLSEVPGIGASVSGRHESVACSTGYDVRTPARKDAFPGVRAWSPPV